MGLSSCPPLYFETLETMRAVRAKAGVVDDDHPLSALARDVPGALDTLFPLDGDDRRRHAGTVAVALLLLGHGLTDECHDLVTPLSWPDDVHFAHGPSTYDRVDPDARWYSTYAHCLVHRREAFHAGEFGMVGFSNADFWSNAAHARTAEGPDASDARREITARVRALAAASPSAEATEWARSVLGDEDDEPYLLDSRDAHRLCARVLRAGNDGDRSLRDFAERVAETELRVLLGRVLRMAGYDVDADFVAECRGE